MEIRPFRPASAKPADQKHYINVSCFCNEFPAFTLCSPPSPVMKKIGAEDKSDAGESWRAGHPLVSPPSVGLVI